MLLVFKFWAGAPVASLSSLLELDTLDEVLSCPCLFTMRSAGTLAWSKAAEGAGAGRGAIVGIAWGGVCGGGGTKTGEENVGLTGEGDDTGALGKLDSSINEKWNGTYLDDIDSIGCPEEICR